MSVHDTSLPVISCLLAVTLPCFPPTTEETMSLKDVYLRLYQAVVLRDKGSVVHISHNKIDQENDQLNICA